mmetsp:Transcript_1337/g.2908  ORF Transcript_1337/g.2908 Transcript_1337/m.2908 type:complete len:95 (-) Transcript_1337:181-465(-)
MALRSFMALERRGLRMAPEVWVLSPITAEKLERVFAQVAMKANAAAALLKEKLPAVASSLLWTSDCGGRSDKKPPDLPSDGPARGSTMNAGAPK